MNKQVKTFFDEDTYTLSYIVYDDITKDAIIIDPVLDYNQALSKVSFDSCQKILNFIEEFSLKVYAILETHAHADHLSGAAFLREQLGDVKIGIGEEIKVVQEVFKEVFNLKKLSVNGNQFDILFKDNEEYSFGSINIKVLSTPGHTPACCSFLIHDMLFTGDALFMPDFGTGRCDFPAGSAKELYHSIQEKIYKLPKETRFFTGHDYQPGGRELRFESTLEESMNNNIQLKMTTTEEDFVEFRTTRDKKLKAPQLLLPSIQVNINAGELPEKDDNGVSYLRLPISN